MNYYEELGVSPAASIDEIRHAYKTLARLLHPDAVADEHVKRLAELQMRRLNHILATLTDPAARRRYDLEAEGSAPAVIRRRVAGMPAPPALRKSPWRSLAIGICSWLPPVAGVAFVMAALLYTGTSTPAPVAKPLVVPVTTAHAPPPAPPAEASTRGRGVFHRDLKTGAVESKATLRAGLWRQAGRPQPIEEPPAVPGLSGGAMAAPSPLALQPDVPPVPAPAAKVPAIPLPAERRRFAGNWFYIPPREKAASQGVYPPEYIELHLTENHGILQGHYRARYRVMDQAISPDVEFHFEGPGSIPKAELGWSGMGAAMGKVTLRLVSPVQLEVSWIATQLSEELGLVSGEAELVREQESR